MLDDMKLHNMVDGTRRAYVRAVADFSAFHGRSPDLDEAHLHQVRITHTDLVPQRDPAIRPGNGPDI